jgi:hypothetical protein
MFAQRLEAAEPLERVALLAAKIVECPAPAAAGVASENVEQRAEDRQLQTCDRPVVDQRRIAAMGEAALEVGRIGHCAHAFGRIEFRNGRYLDKQDIEKKPARGRVRACALRCVEKHRMERVEPDHRSAEVGGEFGEAFEIAEIADAPIVFRPQQIELERYAPDRRLIGQVFRHETTPGHNDQRHFGGIESVRFDPQHVIADLRRRWDNEASALERQAGFL